MALALRIRRGPDPSLNRTRYCRRHKPGLMHMVHHLSPGLGRLPSQSGQLELWAAPHMLVLSSIDPRVHAVARQVHALRIAAYEQEAKLLGAADFPPLRRGLEDILNSSEEFVGAFEEQSLAGVLSICEDEEGRGMSISSLVVHPICQRRGIGSALLRAATEQHRGEEITIQTAAANFRALALYSQFGFKEYRRWCYGGETLELVKLSRPPAPTQSTA